MNRIEGDAPSAALEVGGAALRGGRHSGHEVFGLLQTRLFSQFVGGRGSDAVGEVAAKRGANRPDRQRGGCGDFGGELASGRSKLGQRGELVGQSHGHGLLAIDPSARVEQLGGPLLVYQSGQGHAEPETMVDSEPSEVGAESSLGRGHSEVSGQSKPEAPTDGCALHGGDDRCGGPEQSCRGFIEVRNRASGSGREVGSGTEVLSFGTQEHSSAARVIAELLQCLGEFVDHLEREEVVRWPPEFHLGHMIVSDLGCHVGVAHEALILRLTNTVSETLSRKHPRVASVNRLEAVEVGIHLPQAGPAASGESMRRAALLAEELGYSDVWVSDHLVIPAGVKYPPSAYVYEPVVVMAWVAAVTKRVRIGTTVLVIPMRNPIVVAKMLASIDQMSGGRVILGAAAGWLEAEFNALGVPYDERGPRTDEALDMIRKLWTEDHITATFPVHGAEFESIRAKPQPARPIPIWIGGHAEVALKRAVRSGDGWHGAFINPAQAAVIIERLREERPDPDFVISLRTQWDPLIDDPAFILDELEEYAAAGVNHIVAEPRQRDAGEYMRSIEQLASLYDSAGVGLAR